MQNMKTMLSGATVVVFVFLAFSVIPGGVWTLESSIFTMLAVISMFLYLLDRTWLWRAVYRFLYNFFHREAMPKEVVIGFVYNQPMSRKLKVAALISFAAFIGTVWELKFSISFLVQIFLGILDVPAVLIGFVLGYWAHHFILHHAPLFDNLDKLSDRLEAVNVGDLTTRAHGITDKIIDACVTLPLRLYRIFSPEPLKPPTDGTGSKG
jgi:hypothetical protein